MYNKVVSDEAIFLCCQCVLEFTLTTLQIVLLDRHFPTGNSYAARVSQVADLSIPFVKGTEGRETTELFTKLDKWEKKEDLSYHAYLNQKKRERNYHF